MRLVSVVTSTRSFFFDALANLVQQVVDLTFHGTHFDFGIDQAGRADDLLDHHAGGFRQLIRARASPKRKLPG